MNEAERRALERALCNALAQSLRPALDRVMESFRRELTVLLTQATTEERPPRKSKLGEPKRCAVCRLKGSQNDPALPPDHTQEDHRRWKAAWKPRVVGRTAPDAA